MPFTPFHLGPGALFKAIGGNRFSFMVFGGSQVLMDVEPLVHILRGDAVLHGISTPLQEHSPSHCPQQRSACR